MRAASLTADLSPAADAALDAFVDAFWDPRKRYFFTYSDREIHPEHAIGPDGGRYSDFWWEAQLWELTMDAYARTREPRWRRLVTDVYEGFVDCYPDFANDYNDDVNWWALGAVRAHRLTGDDDLLRRARELFESILPYQDDVAGGGIWWRRSDGDQKNVATNAPAAMTACGLYTLTGEERYVSIARSLYAWVRERFYVDGRVYDRLDATGTLVPLDYTYNFGTFIGAACALYDVTGEPAYLSDAAATAEWIVTRLAADDGVLPDEGMGDGGGFKMILTRYLHRFATGYDRPEYLPFLWHNAELAWSNRRAFDDLVGPDWSAPAPTAPLQSLTAAAAVDLLQVAATS